MCVNKISVHAVFSHEYLEGFELRLLKVAGTECSVSVMCEGKMYR